jgi:hypothetical protein
LQHRAPKTLGAVPERLGPPLGPTFGEREEPERAAPVLLALVDDPVVESGPVHPAAQGVVNISARL